TLAFLLPLVARLAGGKRATPGKPRALILAPTRELVGQIDTVLAPLAKATGLTSRTVFGGVSQHPQVEALRRGVDIVVACPGRLEDLMQQGHCSLSSIQVTVLDEADHMADLGFLPAVRRILTRTPADGQRLLFSATLDRAVDTLAKQFLHDPVVHEADPSSSPVATMTHHVLQVPREKRLDVLVDLTSAGTRTIVFTRTKHGAKALARQLNRSGVAAVDLHGNLSQNARTRNMDEFHSGRARALVATDIAARGIHVDDVGLVIHADPPADHKAYLHRSGRTARAGNDGTVVTLMTSDQAREVKQLTRAAHIAPTTTVVDSVDHPVLTSLAPGERVLTEPVVATEKPAATPAKAPRAGRSSGAGQGAGRGRRRSSNRQGRTSGTSGANPGSGRTRQGSGKGSGKGSSGPRSSSARVYSTSSSHSAASFSSGRR
ncbi:DEAD/DEAH box helicase, partial [Jatrophihabitans endophyticus]|uniref:DEAD/DEAH box helicase n=1 Tax=Jatrophihabitans endophyticus TaxID=1206085 RepID=UPI001A00AFCF